MKKLLLVALLGIMTSGAAFSKNDDRKAAFQFGLFPPLTTNWIHAPQYTNEVSVNLLVSVSRNVNVFTFGTLANIIRNNASGLQLAGVCNYVGNENTGFQFSYVFNYAKKMTGVQASQINVSGATQGAQLGIFNISKDVEGAQVAFFLNVAKNVKGAQFAFVNVADSCDWPIGIINIVKKGEMSLGVSYDRLGNTLLSFRSGGKYGYGIFGMGYNHKKTGSQFVLETGVGINIPCVSWFRIRNEVKMSFMGVGPLSAPAVNIGYYLFPAFKIGNHFELFGGASFSYLAISTSKNKVLLPGDRSWGKNAYSHLFRTYIGYQAGVQYLF